MVVGPDHRPSYYPMASRWKALVKLKEMPREKAVVVLLDYLPRSWESRDEFHFRLAKKLVAKGIVPVFVYSGPLPTQVEERFLSSGAKLHSMNYGQGRRAYSQLLGRL